jgi:hypothetical protein
MHLTLLTPLGALVALLGLLPFAALWLNERRARRIRSVLRVEAPPRASRAPTLVSLVVLPALLGLALAQPVLERTRGARARTDAQAFYVFDTSVSMAASAGPRAPTRLDRAIAEATRLHFALQEVPSGVATMTDRVLPNVFPTTDGQEFAAALADTVGIDAPPPKGLSDKATTFAALDTFAGTNFFSPGIAHRLVILFTDGETVPYFPGDLRQALRTPPHTSFLVVHVWRAGERIYLHGKPDPAYREDPRSGHAVSSLASLLGGRSVGEGKVAAAARDARQLLGPGRLAHVGVGLHVTALAPWLVLVSLVPLLVVVWRRNLLT